MDSKGVAAAERRIWETICESAPGCEAIGVTNPWSKLDIKLELPVGIHGQGLLSWLPEAHLKKVRSFASGPVVGDRLQIVLVQTATKSVPLPVRLLVRSDWSRTGIPMTEALAFPEGIILGKDEASEALSYEVDYYCLWVVEGEQNFILIYAADEYPRGEVEVLLNQMRAPGFLKSYFTIGGVRETCPRHTRKYPVAKKPVNAMITVPVSQDPGLILLKQHTRMFAEHRIFEVLNIECPIHYI